MTDGKKIIINVVGSFFSLLAVASIILKICGIIECAWVWVLAFPCIGVIVMLGFIFFIFIILYY